MIPGSGISAGEGIGYPLQYSWASLVVQLVKNPLQCRRFLDREFLDPGRSGSFLDQEDPPGEGKGYPLQYSGLENSMDCIVPRVAKSQT